MKKRDYYDILGVPRTAGEEEIQKAYRRLARTLHPDVNKDKDAEKRFKELSEAREVLKDPEKRKLYDNFGHQWRQAGEANRASPRSTSRGRGVSGARDRYGDATAWQDVVEDLFRRSSGGFGSWETEPEDFARDSTVEAEVSVSLADVFFGTTKTLTLMTYNLDGDGSMRPMQRTLQVKIPKGIEDGATLRLAGQGGGGRSPHGHGDLHLRIRIAPDSHFTRDGHDLLTIVAVSPWEAALGASIPVRTLDGTVTVRVPKGSQNRQRLRLRGKGMPKREGGYGDLLVELEIRVPEVMEGEEERLFRELAKISRFDPRAATSQKKGRAARD